MPNKIPVYAMNNLEMLPGGSGVYNRRGLEAYLLYNSTTSPLGRKAILIDSQPPNINDGTFMALIVNTQNAQAVVEKIGFIKPRTNLPGDTFTTTLRFDEQTYTADIGDDLTVTVVRDGELSKQVTVDYVSAYYSGSSSADWTAVSGTLTFAAGVVSQTITVHSADTGQLSNKGGTITLSNPTGRSEIGTPNPCNIVFETSNEYDPITYSRPSDLSTAVPVMMYASASEAPYAHYLTGFQGSSGTAPSTTYLKRVGADALCYFTCFDTGSATTVYANLYSITQMISDGAAYSASATSKSAAIKTLPYSVTLIGTDFPVQENTAGKIGDKFYCSAYDSTRFVVMTVSKSYVVTLSTGATSAHSITSSHAGSYDSLTSGAGGGNASNVCVIDKDGNAVITAVGITASVPVAGWLMKINPITGATVLEGTPASTYQVIFGAIKSGGVFGTKSDVGYVYVSPTLTPTGVSGSFGEADVGVYWLTTNSVDRVVLIHKGTNPEAYDYTNNVLQIATTTALATVSSMSTNSNALNYRPGAGFFSDSTFYVLQSVISSATLKLLAVTTASGSTVSTVSVTDTYGGQAHDTDIAAMTDGTMVYFGSTGGFFGNASGACFIPDMFWFNPRFINGAL